MYSIFIVNRSGLLLEVRAARYHEQTGAVSAPLEAIMTSTVAAPLSDDQPRMSADDARLRVRREVDRNHLAELADEDDFEHTLRQAARRLPAYAEDVCFGWIVRRLWREHRDKLPDSLEEKYRALRDEVSWLEDALVFEGDLPRSGLHELAALLVGFQSRHRHLTGLVWGRGRP
jgi:hypothetical protein